LSKSRSAPSLQAVSPVSLKSRGALTCVTRLMRIHNFPFSTLDSLRQYLGDLHDFGVEGSNYLDEFQLHI
jgi:hypothetical protein